MPAVANIRALWIVLIVAWATSVFASPRDELKTARDSFRAGDYQKAITELSALLYPKARLAAEQHLAESHLLLGVSYFETGDAETAKREFEQALFLDQKLRLEPVLFSDKVVRFFDDVKRELAAQRRANEETRRLEAEGDALRRALESTVLVEERARYVNYVPFGAGQFQNGHRSKGLFFAISQGALATTSTAFFIYLTTKYRLQKDGVPLEEAQFARNLQILQVTSGGICLGLMAWGIVDSLYYYKPTIRREPGEEGKKLLQELLPKPQPPKSSFRLSPTLVPGGGTMQATWEF